MTTATHEIQLSPEDVERAAERDGKHYELIDGELREKLVGAKSLYIAMKIAERLNGAFYPTSGVAIVEAMLYCFDRPRHGRKPDVLFVKWEKLAERKIPTGDFLVVPDLVVEVLSPGNSGIELEEKLDEYLAAAVPMVWIVNPDGQTIRVYRQDGTTRLFRTGDPIENEPLLPGFRLVAGEVFPVAIQ
jgi:Uma2 family endonuclease